MDEQSWTHRLPPDVHGDVWRRELSSVAQLRTVRAELRARLPTCGPVDADDSFGERFLLAFEELASNALRHGGRPVQAQVVATDDGLLIEISDSLPERVPEPPAGRDPALGGLGLQLVARLTAAHGWHVVAGRKYVWACCT